MTTFKWTITNCVVQAEGPGIMPNYIGLAKMQKCVDTQSHTWKKAIAICPLPLLGGIIKKMSNYFMICVHFTMYTVTNPGVWGDLPWTQHNVDEP